MPRKVDFEKLDKKWPSVPRVPSRYLSRIPCILGLVGSTGSGKSVLAVDLIAKLRREGSVTRVFVISPTANSNQILNEICVNDRDWKIEPNSTVFKRLTDIEESCEADAEEFREKLEYQIALRKYTSGDAVSMAEQNLLEKHNFEEVKPIRPSPLLFLDDCQSTGPLFSNSSKNLFTGLVLRSRHVGQGTGLSIVLAAQTSRGIPRGLRLNFTHLFLFRTQSIREKKILYEECGSLLSEMEFDRMLDLYTTAPHGYMFIDLWAKTIGNTY